MIFEIFTERYFNKNVNLSPMIIESNNLGVLKVFYPLAHVAFESFDVETKIMDKACGFIKMDVE